MLLYFSFFLLSFFASFCFLLTFIFLNLNLKLNSKRGVRIIPVDSGMGVEDWESRYKVPDSGLLDDYLDSEQKLWEDEDKSIIYRIGDSCESKGSRFYQTVVECDRLSETNDGTQRKRRGFGSGEVRLVYREAGSFEDEASPPEIDIIPSVKQLRQPSYTESLLYKTRLWAKTAVEDTLENYAAFCEEEAAREEAEGIRRRTEYNSIGSDEMQYSFGSEEELEDLTFTEGDADYEYENYYHPGRYTPTFQGQEYEQDPQSSPPEEPADEYIDPIGELRSLVHSVSQYLAVKEEEILKYESMPKAARRKLPTLPTESKAVQQEEDKKAEVKEESSVEQGMSGVKNAMSSLFSSITGSKSPTDVETPGPSPQPSPSESGISKLLSFIPKANPDASEGSAPTEPPTSQPSPQPESGISKLLAFIPKSGGTSPPVAVVPPACQEPTPEKFSLQSLLAFHPSDPSRQADAHQTPEHVGAEAGTQSGLESLLGRLSPLRLFSRELSPQPSEQRGESAASKDSQPSGPNRQGSQTERPDSGSGSVDLLPDTGSGSIELSQETGSGSVELLPETESSGELPDIQQRGTTAVSEPKPEAGSMETGFFSPFKKSLSTLISTGPPEGSSQPETKPPEESFLGSKFKIPFFSENASTSTPPKTDRGGLSDILKLGSGEDVTTSNTSSPSPARSASPSRAALFESGPKGNAGTGWFSNLFKVTPGDPAKEPATKQSPPTVTLTKPCGQTEPEDRSSDPSKSTASSAEQPLQEQPLAESHVASEDEGPHKVTEGKSQPETSQPQGILSGLLKIGQTDLFDKKTEGEGQPHQGGLFSGLFSPSSPSSPQTQQSSATQQPGMLSGLLKLTSDAVSNPPTSAADQSGQTPAQGQGLLSGFLKKATDSIIHPGSQQMTSSQESQPKVADEATKAEGPGPNQSQRPAPSPGLLSRLKFGSSEGSADKPDQQPGASEHQPAAEQTPLKTPVSQSGGLFGGLLKLTEPSPQQTSPSQGGLLSGLFGIGGQDSASQPSQSQPQCVKSEKPPDPQPGDKLQPNQVPPPQSSSGPGGMLSGLFNKITDVGAPQSATVNQPPQQQAQRPGPRPGPGPIQQPPSQQGGFLSGLFSSGPNAPVGHQNQQQPQQGNRQPLRRQNQISPQPAATAPEPQQGGLFSGLFNKLASNDNVPQQPGGQPGSQQTNKPAQTSQQGGFLSGLFGPSPPQQPVGKTTSPQQTSTQPAGQTGGLLSGIRKLASGEDTPQEQPIQPPQLKEPAVKPEQTPGLFSGLLNKISATVEQPPVDQVSPQTAQQQQQPRAGQGRPHIQRTKPLEAQPVQEASTEKESKDPPSKGFLSGIFSVTEEPPTKTQQPSSPQPAKEEPKTTTSGSSPSFLSSIFKRDSNTSALGKESVTSNSVEGLPSSVASLPTSSSTNPVVNCPSQVRQDPTASPTQRYLEEIQRLLYGTANEYGYRDLLYNFTEHGVIPPELYDHQCLIEALLWQQLNDYIQAEALATQVQVDQTYQGHAAPPNVAPQWENHDWLNPKDMDISGFNVPSHPWRDAAAQLFENRNRFLDPGEDLVLFDMSCRNKKPWSSCDHLNKLNVNRKPWLARGDAMNLSTGKSRARLSRCQSLAECGVQEFGKNGTKGARNNYVQDENFDLKSATEFLKSLATKKGPVDLRHGALDLSRFAGIAGDADDDVLFEDSEWYQQWLSLLEQGLWWPAEAGDCGYYVYTDQNYIYSLLTDKSGRHLYACATEENIQTLGNITENVVNILKQRESDKVTLCGFKIPLSDESKGFWVPDNQLNNLLQPDTPINLTSALKKGEKVMNMNLESFSQMFQESVSSQAEQPVDFSVYKLKKINVESVQNAHTPQEEPTEAADFSLKSLKGGHGGPYWKNQGLKDMIASPGKSRQIFHNKPYPIPEIKIAHVDDTHAAQSKQTVSFIPSRTIGKPSNTDTSKPKPPLSTSTSTTVSSKVSETSNRTTPSSSKIPGQTELRRKLPELPTVSLTSVSPASPTQTATASSTKTPTSTVPPVSSPRPQLTKQLSQADRPRVLPQANKNFVKENMYPAVTQAPSQKQPQDSFKEPQLHIVNTPVKYSESYLYNRNQKPCFPPSSSQMCQKVLDFSATASNSKNAKQKEDIEASVDSIQRPEVVDCTMYKLKRFKEKKQIDSETSLDFTGEDVAVVDLTKETEEEEVEWPKSESVGTLQDESQTKQWRVFNQQNQSMRSLSRPEVGINHSSLCTQQLPSFHSKSEGAQTNQTTFSVSEKGAADSLPKLFTAVHLSNKDSDLDKGVKQTTRTESIKPVSTSLLQSPVMRKQVGMQSSPTVATGQTQPISSDLKTSTSTPVFCSSEKAQQYQISAPANSVKASLDMSVKTTMQMMQQTVAPMNAPVCEAMSLTRKKPSARVETDQTLGCQEFIDLTYKVVTPESRQDKEVTRDMTPNSFAISREMDPNVDKNVSTNAQQWLSNQSSCDSGSGVIQGQAWQSKHGRLVQLPSQVSVTQQTQEAVTPKQYATTEVLDMSPKPGEAKVEEIVPKDEFSSDQAIPLVNKPSAREVARRDSVGVALIVEQTHPESTSRVQSNKYLVQEVQTIDTVPVQQYPLCSNRAMLYSGVFQSSVRSHSLTTAPANSVKYTLDMSTKTSKSDTLVRSSDPVSLVQTRRSSLSYSHHETLGVPLIVETHHPQERPKRQQTRVVEPQKPIQGFVQSRESSAPANSIRNSLDMSSNSKLDKSETAPIASSSEVVPLVRHKADMTGNCSAGVPLIVEQSACQQKRPITTTETLHRQISTSHFDKTFSNTTFNNVQQQNKPIDFSAKDCLTISTPLKIQTALKDGEPMNCTNVKVKKEISDQKQTKMQSEMKTSVGVVDLTVDLPNKISNQQNAEDFTAPRVPPPRGTDNLRQYTPANAVMEVRNKSSSSQTQKSYQQATPQPRIQLGIQSEAAKSSLSHLVPVERRTEPLQHFVPKTMQSSESTPLPLNVAYQRISSADDKLNQPQQIFPNKSQHSVLRQHFQRPGVEVPMSQANKPMLQNQDTSGQHDVTQRPKVLIKQATVESCGSTEEIEESGIMTSSSQSPVPHSTQCLVSASPTVATTLSLKDLNIQQRTDTSMSPGMGRSVLSQSSSCARYAKGPLQLSKPPDLNQHNITAQHYRTPTLTSTSIDSIQCASQAKAPSSQPTSVPTTQTSTSSTPAGSSSVKSLISLFSDLNAQSESPNSSAPVSHHAKVVSKPVDHSKGDVPPQMLPCRRDTFASVTHVKTTESVTSNAPTPIVSSTVTHIQGNAESKPVTPQIKIISSSELSKDQSAAIKTELTPKIPLTSEHRGWISDTEGHQSFKPPTLSQDCQQPQAAVNVCTERTTAEEESPIPETSPVTLPENNLHKESQSFDGSAEMSQTLPEPASEEMVINETTVHKSDTSQQPVSDETKLTLSTQSVTVSGGLGEVPRVSNESQERSRQPRSIYIGINSQDVPPFSTDDEPEDLKPYVRLPHIFVSAASSPEEEPNECEMSESRKPDVTEVGALRDVAADPEKTPDQDEFLPDAIVSKSNKSNNESSIVEESAELSVDEVETPPNNQDSPKSSATGKFSNADVKSESNVAYKPELSFTSTDSNVSTSNKGPLQVPTSESVCQDENLTLVEKTPKVIKSSEESSIKDENKPSEAASVLPETVQCALKESAEEVQHGQDKPEKEPEPGPAPISSPIEEVAVPKEDSAPDKVDLPKTDQTNEQTGKGVFSLFSGSTETPQQTAAQTGLSVFSGILPGSSTKDTSGTGLLSMFGGSNAPPSSESKDTVPHSTPQEPQGKGLFSMFGGSSVQPPFGPRGPTVGGVRPRGPPPKEPPGKGLFSMFGTSAPQQPPSPKGHPGVGPTPRGPSTGSSLFGGILQGSATHKDTPGLFSKFGSLGSQPQTGPRGCAPAPTVTPPRPSVPESSGKGLFSMFSGPNQDASEAQPAVSKPAESDGGFKVSSVFSLAGISDGNKSKTGFGLFGMSFLEETKTEPEKNAPVKEDTTSQEVNPQDAEVLVKEVKDDHGESVTHVPTEPPSTSSDLQDTAKEFAKNDTQIIINKETTNQLDFSSNQNASAMSETSIPDELNFGSSLPGKEGPEQVSETQSDILSENKDTDDVVELVEFQVDALEIKSSSNQSDIAEVSRSSERICTFQTPENVPDFSEIPTSADINVEEIKSVAEDGVTTSESQDQTEDTLKVAIEEQTAVIDAVTSPEEPLKVSSEEQKSITIDENSFQKPLEDDRQKQLPVAAVENSPEEGLEVSGTQQTSVGNVENLSDEPLKIAGEEPTAITDVETLTKEVTVDDSEKTTADLTERNLPLSSDGTVKEPTEAKLEAAAELPHESHKTCENEADVTVASSSNEDKAPGGPSIAPASPLPLQQPTQGIVRPPGPPRPTMGGPRMGGPQMGSPRMPGPRMVGPRQQGPQKVPEAAPFSGFMSMFSSSAPSKSPTVGGFFSSSPGSFFGSSPHQPPPRQQQQQQPKSSFFGLPSSIATESITGDLFGMFKSSEATKSEEPPQVDTKPGQDLSENPMNSGNAVNSNAESAPSTEDGHVKSIEDLPEKGLVEEAERKDKSEDESSLVELTIKSVEDPENDKHSVGSRTEESLKDAPPVPPEAKGVFDIPSLTNTMFGSMSVATDGISSIGSLFSTTSAAKTQHQQTDLFSGFKSFSVSVFQEDKMTGKEETSTPSSVFGLKLSSMFGASDSPKPESGSPSVTTRPPSESPIPADESDEPDSNKPSPGSGETEGADASDTEGPTETSKTGSCDTLAQTPQSDLPSLSGSLSEGLDKQTLVMWSQLEQSEGSTPETRLTGVGTKDLLSAEAAKRLVSV